MYILGAAAVGKSVLRRNDPFYAFVVGETLISFLILALGLAGLYSQKTFLILLIPLSILGLFQIPKISFQNPVSGEKLQSLEILCVVLILAVLLAAAVSCGTPPTDWDSLAYHLAFPKIFLSEGRLSPLDWSFHIHFPLSPEMISTFLYSIRGAQAVHWMNFFRGFILLCAMFDFASRHFNRLSAFLACAIFACQPIFLRVNGNASTDFAVALPAFLALRVFLEDDSAFLCGLLAGAAASSKLSGLWAASSLAVLYLPRPKHLLKFILGVLLLGSPWYLRNFIWKGNPFWPYFGKIFGSGSFAAGMAERSKLIITEGLPKTLLNWLMTPLNLCFRQHRYGQQTFFLVPVFWVLLGWRAGNLKKNPFSALEKKTLLFLALFMTFWFWVYQMWRYFLPAIAVISILSADGMIAMLSQNKKGVILSLCLMIASVSPVATLSFGNPLYAFFGVRSKVYPQFTPDERYLEALLGPAYSAMRRANQILPRDSNVLLYREVRGYMLDRKYSWGNPLNPGPIDFETARTPDDIMSALKTRGFTHILYNPYVGPYPGAPEYYARIDQMMGEFLVRHTEPIIDEKGVVLAAIK